MGAKVARLANRSDLGCYRPMAFKNIAHLIPTLLALSLGCAKTDGAEVVAPEVVAVDAAPDGIAAETRAKLLTLAAASECLRKRDVPPEEGAASMMALYRAHQIDLETYTREMSRLAGDPAFQAEVDALANTCPTPAPDVAAATPEVVDTTPEPETIAEVIAETTVADTTPETVADTTVAEVADTTVAEVADTTLMDTRVVDATITDTRVVDVTITDTRVADVADVKVKETDDDTQGGRDFSGNWTGQLSGVKPAGTVRMTVVGRRITSAVASFGRTDIRLRGTFTEKGLLTLGGSSGGDSIHITGEAYTNGRILAGRWDGTIDKRKGSGHAKMKR